MKKDKLGIMTFSSEYKQSSGKSKLDSNSNAMTSEDRNISEGDNTMGENAPSEDQQPEAEQSNLFSAVKAEATDVSMDSINLSSKYKQSLQKSKADSDPDKNFTWEHFFTVHCGILPSDARKYEEAMIAHRLDPLNTLYESLGLIIEYGRIPIGDKLKITRTIEAKEKDTKSKEEAMEKARKSLGLENYNDMEANWIMDRAGGDSEYHIEYGIERYEEDMKILERMIGIQMIKDPKIAESYASGVSLARVAQDPTLKLLRSFGYETFEYTKDKVVVDAVVHNSSTSSDPLATTLLLGNAVERPELNENVPDNMYS